MKVLISSVNMDVPQFIKCEPEEPALVLISSVNMDVPQFIKCEPEEPALNPALESYGGSSGVEQSEAEYEFHTVKTEENMNEENKPSDEWKRKRSLANARMKKYRGKKRSASIQLEIIAQNDPEIKKMRRQIQEEKAQRKKDLARERSRRYRDKKRIDAFPIMKIAQNSPKAQLTNEESLSTIEDTDGNQSLEDSSQEMSPGDCSTGVLEQDMSWHNTMSPNNILEPSEAVQGTDCCILDHLIRTPAEELSFEEMQAIIETGRPTPDLSLTTKLKNYTRYFKNEYFSYSKWLCACISRKKLFCWPCILFSGERNVWTSTGFCDLNNFHKAKFRHEKAVLHLSSITKLKMFDKPRETFQLSTQQQAEILKHNEEVDVNRKVMKRLINLTCLFTKLELPFGGLNGCGESLNVGNYREFLQLLSKYDSKLCIHLKSTGSYGASNEVQNALIGSIHDVIKVKIKEYVCDSPFVALLLYETGDGLNQLHLSTVLRYLKDGEIRESFIGFTDVSKDHSVAAICEHVSQVVQDFHCGDKLVAYSYSGTVRSVDDIKELKLSVKRRWPSAVFSYCYAQRLSLILSQALAAILECKIFFKMLNGLPSFLSRSNHTNSVANSLVYVFLPSKSSSSSCSITKLLRTVSENKAGLIALLSDIENSPDNWENETFIAAKGYSTYLNSFTFLFLLEILNHIFSHSEALFNRLQKKTYDIAYCIEEVILFISFIKEDKKNFEEIYKKSCDKCKVPEQPTKKFKAGEGIDSKSRYFNLYNEIYDTVFKCVEVLFKDLEQLLFLKLVDWRNFKVHKSKFPEDVFASLKSNYKGFFNLESLRSELTAMYRLSDFSKLSVKGIMRFLRTTELAEEAYTELYKVCSLTCTIPMLAPAVDHIHPSLKRILNYAQNEQCLKLSVLSVEKALVKELQGEKDFCDSVIEKFLLKRGDEFSLKYK